jgi:hypothetical protein
VATGVPIFSNANKLFVTITVYKCGVCLCVRMFYEMFCRYIERLQAFVQCLARLPAFAVSSKTTSICTVSTKTTSICSVQQDYQHLHSVQQDHKHLYSVQLHCTTLTEPICGLSEGYSLNKSNKDIKMLVTASWKQCKWEGMVDMQYPFVRLQEIWKRKVEMFDGAVSAVCYLCVVVIRAL